MKNARFRAVLFDLDGTLLDTLEDLSDSVNAALRSMGFPLHRNEDYKLMIGEGVRHLALCALPASERERVSVQEELIDRIGIEYAQRWNAKTRPYAGVPELLDALVARDVAMAVLSNKPHEFTRLNVDALLCRWSFDSVIGQRAQVPAKPDPGSALETAGALGIQPAAFLYLGDSGVDMRTASAAGMYPVGVLWGFRGEEELIAGGARSLVKHPLEVLELLR